MAANNLENSPNPTKKNTATTSQYHGKYIFLADKFIEGLTHVTSRAFALFAMLMCQIPKYKTTDITEYWIEFEDMRQVLDLPASYQADSKDGKGNMKKLITRIMDEWCGTTDADGNINQYPVVIREKLEDGSIKETYIIEDWDIIGDALRIELNNEILPYISGLGCKGCDPFTQVWADNCYRLKRAYSWDIFSMILSETSHKYKYKELYPRLYTSIVKNKIGQSMEAYTKDVLEASEEDGAEVLVRKFQRTRWEERVLDPAMREIMGDSPLQINIIKQTYKNKKRWYYPVHRNGHVAYYTLTVNVRRDLDKPAEAS